MGELTRVDPIESLADNVAPLAGTGPAFGRHVPRTTGIRPTSGTAAAADEDILLRLAVGLAVVAGEAAAVASQTRGEADDPPAVEPAR
jgi:hypothetical protein